MIKTFNLNLLNSLSDHEYKQPTRWQKFNGRIVSPRTVDLDKRGGYALGGKFVNYGDAFTIQDGEYLLVTIEQQDGEYLEFFRCDGETLVPVAFGACRKTVRESEALTETQKVQALKNDLYLFACYLRTVAPPVAFV